WAHRTGEGIQPGEVYRDADTLGRFLEMIAASKGLIAEVEAAKAEAVNGLSAAKAPNATAPAPPTIGDGSSSSPPATLFRVGELVALRSNPKIILPVIEVIP